MSAGRIILVHVLIFAIVLGHAYDVIMQREHWPFSPYPMYSKLQTSRKFRLMRLTAITYETPNREMELDLGAYLRNQLRELVDNPATTETQLSETLRQHLKRFEQQASWRAGREIPAKLRGLRLYDCQWNLRADAGNLNKPKIRLAGQYVRLAESSPILRPRPPFGKLDWTTIKGKKDAVAARRAKLEKQQKSAKRAAATQAATTQAANPAPREPATTPSAIGAPPR